MDVVLILVHVWEDCKLCYLIVRKKKEQVIGILIATVIVSSDDLFYFKATFRNLHAFSTDP